MKKWVMAMSVMGLIGEATAQSTVTLAGTVDLSARRVEHGNLKHTLLAQDGLNYSQLVFRGREDLGDGLWAGFALQAGINPDTGSVNAKFWNRRSTVSLGGSWGELRVGRDLNPTTWNNGIFDPWGTTGIGNFLNVVSVLGSGAATLIRTDNAIDYLLPDNLGGFYGQVMVAPSEGIVGNKYTGARIGYRVGQFDGAIAGAETVGIGGFKYKTYNAGASYDFDVVKIMAQYNIGQYTALRQGVIQLGVLAPFGQWQLRAAYTRADASGGSTDKDDARMIAAGLIYNLSKRSAIYGSYSKVSNKGNARFSTDFTQSTPAVGGFTSNGYELGVRHFF
jgi:predicted porin